MQKRKTVSVVGAGVAGLASAIRLQHAGYEVEIYEKESTPGGKMNVLKKDGYQFDLGPSIVMMPDLYREVFELVGRDPDDYIPMQRLDPMYSAFFNDGKEKFDVSSDLVTMIREIEKISEEDSQGYLAYLDDIYKRFIIAKDHFLQQPFRNKRDFYNPTTLLQGLRLKTFDTAEHSISKYIKDEKLKQMLSFQTLYIGVSPKNGPSLYTIIPMIEILYGIWFIKGGMHTMAKAMERLFLELGGSIHYHSDVQEILIVDQKAKGIAVDGEEIYSDYVMCNADFPYAMKNLVKDVKSKGKYTDKKIDKMKYSCSCFVLYLGMDRKYDEVENLHNFMFSKNLDQNLEQIFNGERLEDPSVYLYVPTKGDASLAPEGKEGLYILVPVSELSIAQYEWNDETIRYYRDKVFENLKNLPGMENIEQEVVTEAYTTPLDWESKFNAYNGATFGLQPILTQSNHMRPQSKATHCENLYFTGSSTHPGAGVPIVLLSAKIATDELQLDDKDK
ncbi:phytoene desaturase family protein [Jeotgalibaca sp. MA1X17-3]|uniref:phytoene desaturase family protein n=1 Tax=Jeotgalibaca sp. MA1X17-3 TaxID=2908211 RepID=UPI001F48F958|nr:phytoene desaturase family protein [Jeotgalibaca sp. MA1X17-3]UJF16086.1 phytoene desaturase family protein [Jeotgalibaca sp. MA1X17-3]